MLLLLFRFLLLLAWKFPSGVCSTSSFPWKSMHAWNNGAWGEFCYDLTTYTPTCGWQVVIKSPILLDRVEVWDSYYTTKDNFVFTLTNLSYSGDFKNRNQCTNINLFGQFGTGVCGWRQLQNCGSDENIYSPSTAQEIGTAVNHPLLGEFNAAPKTLRAAPDLCYVGEHSIVLSEASHLLDCAAMCADLSKCTGINYRSRARQCQLVYEVVDRNPRLMGAEDGCTFWKIIQPF